MSESTLRWFAASSFCGVFYVTQLEVRSESKSTVTSQRCEATGFLSRIPKTQLRNSREEAYKMLRKNLRLEREAAEAKVTELVGEENALASLRAELCCEPS